jgi:hypothetical protein
MSSGERADWNEKSRRGVTSAPGCRSAIGWVGGWVAVLPDTRSLYLHTHTGLILTLAGLNKRYIIGSARTHTHTKSLAPAARHF